jgi:hypothetical protein
MGKGAARTQYCAAASRKKMRSEKIYLVARKTENKLVVWRFFSAPIRSCIGKSYFDG